MLVVCDDNFLDGTWKWLQVELLNDRKPDNRVAAPRVAKALDGN